MRVCLTGAVEFLLGLGVHHTSAVCSRETVVMSLYRTHFERLFKRRNPKTLLKLASTAELQLTRRVIKPNIVEFLPLIKCFVYKLQEVKREAGKKFVATPSLSHGESGFDLPSVSFEENVTPRRGGGRHKSYSWSNSVQADEQTVPHKPRSIVYRTMPDSRGTAERKTSNLDLNRSILSRVKAQRKRVTSLPNEVTSPRNEETCHDAAGGGGSLAPTYANVEMWYMNKSFLPGLRSKATTTMSQSSGYHSDGSTGHPHKLTNHRALQQQHQQFPHHQPQNSQASQEATSIESYARWGSNLMKTVPQMDRQCGLVHPH